MRFLIDHCLTPHLVAIAEEMGHEAVRSNAVLGRAAEDAAIITYAKAEGLVAVTLNVRDFRRICADLAPHPGLVSIEQLGRSETIAGQCELFRAVLYFIDDDGVSDLAGQEIVVRRTGAGDPAVWLLPLPRRALNPR